MIGLFGIDPTSVGGMFQNEQNAKEGWGVFLVEDPHGDRRLEIQKYDAKTSFKTDAGARAFFRRKMAAIDGRYAEVAEEIKRHHEMSHARLFHPSALMKERYAK